MNRKPEIPEPTKAKMDELIALSSEAFQAGDLMKSHEIALQAWDLIPEPKEMWDYYPQSLSRTFVEDFIAFGDKEGVQKWVATMAVMFDDPNHEDLEVLSMETNAMFSFKDFDRAYYVVARILEIYGEGVFQGDRREWLTFYQQERAKRNEQ